MDLFQEEVAMTKTASATTDMKAATFNNQLISTIGRRKTIINQTEKRSFGSFLQNIIINALEINVKEKG